MSKEKYAWRDPSIPIEKKLDLAQKGLWRMIARIVGAIKDKYGEEGLEVIRESFRHWDEHRKTVERAGIVGGKGSIQDFIFKVMDANDSIFLSMNKKREITEEPDENRVHLRFPECNVARIINRECPEACYVTAIPASYGWAEAVNPNLKITQYKCLAMGDDACCVHLEMIKPSSGS